ncbi:MULTISPECIES: hypothetical protein [Salmonella]|uniref:hypothetical protein n=1 Tax=Salmonella TaxID=590 RepID=UPI00397FB0E0
MKIIKIISAIAMSYFLSGCMTSSLLDTIKTESAPTTEVWKTDEIKSIKPSTTTNGEETWTFVGEDNNYQLDIKDDNINTTTRNFVTLLNNPHIDKRIIEFSKQLYCSTDSKKENKQNEFHCVRPSDIGYSYKSLTEEEKSKVREAFYVHENDPCSPFYFTLAGKIQPKDADNENEILLKSSHKINFTRDKKHFSAKVLLMPFSIIGDVVTAPFQAIGYIIIMNSLPAMRY